MVLSQRQKHHQQQQQAVSADALPPAAPVHMPPSANMSDASSIPSMREGTFTPSAQGGQAAVSEGVATTSPGEQVADAAEDAADYAESSLDDIRCGQLASVADAASPVMVLAEVKLFQSFVHWRLRCWRRRAAIRMHQQMNTLARLEVEAKRLLTSSTAAEQQAADGSDGDADKQSEEYCAQYLTTICPLLVSFRSCVCKLKHSIGNSYQYNIIRLASGFRQALRQGAMSHQASATYIS